MELAAAQTMEELNHRETRNVLIDKLIRAYEIDTEDIADCVELYYDAQDLRIAHANKERSEGPGELKSWFAYWLQIGESVIKSKLDNWVNSKKSPPEAKWAYSQVGIGAIIASGLAAHIDVARANTVSSLWKFAGMAPGFDKRIKSQKLQYNSRLKVLCWKAGQSFVKVSGKDGATYGKLYVRFKAEEVTRNEGGLYAVQARTELEKKNFRLETLTRKRLEAGKLSDAHLHARACRRTVKIFLADYWLVARKAKGLSVNKPYAIDILGHSGLIDNVSQSGQSKPIDRERANWPKQSIAKERKPQQPEKPKAI